MLESITIGVVSLVICVILDLFVRQPIFYANILCQGQPVLGSKSSQLLHRRDFLVLFHHCDS